MGADVEKNKTKEEGLHERDNFRFSDNEDDDHISDSNLCLSFEYVQTLCDYSALRALNSQATTI